MESGIYVGLLTESDSKHYAHRQFSHNEIRMGREVAMFHCWRSEGNKVGPAFGDELEISKIKEIDRWIRDNPTDL
jgi:hypothetical protein